MMPDLLHVLVPVFEIQALAERKRVPFYHLFHREEIYLAFVMLIILSLLGKNI